MTVKMRQWFASTQGKLAAISLAVLGASPALAQVAPPPPALAPPWAPVAAPAPSPGASPSMATMEDGDRLRAAGDLRGALRVYRSLLAVAAKAPLQQRVAETEDALVRHGAAYDAYRELLTSFGTELTAEARAHAERRVVELGALTGLVTIVGGEPGTEVRVDGELAAITPLPQPLRMTRGERRMDLSKPGFEVRTLMVVVSERPVELAGDLTAYVVTGTLEVRGTTSDYAELYVDGSRVGPLPATLELPAGTHQISALGPSVIASTTRITIGRQRVTSLALDLFPRPGEVDIDAGAANATILVDGLPVGMGRYRGALPAGRHEIELRLPGYAPQRQSLELLPGKLASLRAGTYLSGTAGLRETPTSALAQDAEGRSDTKKGEEEPEDLFSGLYGNLLVPVMLWGDSTHSYQSECPAAAFSGGACTATGPKGGALGLRLGYSFAGWIGIEAMAAGAVDVTTSRFTIPSETLSAPGSPISQELVDLAGRSAFVRIGGIVGGGLRLSTPIQGIRFTVGANYVYIARKVFAIPDAFAGVNLGYSVPGWFIDGGIQLGGTPGGRFYLGAFLLMEQAHDLVLNRDLSQLQLSPTQTAVAEQLTKMTVYRGPQYFFGPLIGMAFGH